MLVLLSLLAGCCGSALPPILDAPEDAWTDMNEVYEIPVETLVLESSLPVSDLEVTAHGGDNLQVGVQEGTVYAIPETDWSGRSSITVEVVDKCSEAAEVTFELGVGAMGGDCTHTLVYTAQGAPDRVSVAGDFNAWGRTDLADQGDGTWAVELPLSPGAYAYKVVEHSGSSEQWACDPNGAFFQCDAGYSPTSWDDCSLGADSCNSMLVVSDCKLPTVSLDHLSIDRSAGSVDLRVGYTAGATGAALGTVAVTLDGADHPVTWDGSSPLELTLDSLTATRHTVRVDVTDANGRAAEQLYVPFWTDDLDWDRGLLYYAFVDRFANGDPSNDAPYGSSHTWTDYMGGDWAGVRSKLDYLEDLGVTAIWLTAPVDNASGVWGSKCGATFTGYHGYWPSDSSALEEHFGDEAELRALIDEAHARNIRVLVDWVANHVHEQHPYATEHPEWFNPEALCNDANNWNDIPETCWFDTFLPDINYYNPEPLRQMVDDAVVLAKRWELDGYRVDAVKHMPHPVYYNFQSRVIAEIEHSDVGGDEDFYTVGETFDGDRGLIGSYVNARELDAQFDFPLYFALRSAFTDQGTDLIALEAARADSASAFSGAVMSTFLGNHDVERFVTVADVGAWGVCADEDHIHDPASPPSDWEPYGDLMLAWTWLLTHDGLPLVYYGDEIGLPGHGDPDNRQMMRFPGDLSTWEANVLDHVQRLGRARLDYPQLAVGSTTTWWESADVYAWARSSEHGDALIAVNRTWSDQTLSNGLGWAGLPQGTYLDVLSDTTVTSSGDNLTFTVPAKGSVVLIAQ